MEYTYNPPQSVTGFDPSNPNPNFSPVNYYDPSKPADAAIDTWLQDYGALTDKQAFYLNEMSKYQEQAFQVALMNYQNEYNSPLQQMLRYQAAGLSPWLTYNQNQTPSAGISGNPSARAQAHGSSNAAQKMSSAASFISSAVGVARAATQVYDYIKFGKDISAWNAMEAGSRAANADTERRFNEWFSRISGVTPGEEQTMDEIFANSIRGRQASARTYTQEEKVNQLKAIVDMLPDQKARTQALQALDNYRLQIMQGQNDAILNMNTGNQTIDSFIQLLAYWLFKQNL